MALSASEHLELIDAAIQSTLLAQSYTVRGKAKTMARLMDLYKVRDGLLAEVAQESNGGSMTSLGIMVPVS